MKALLSLSLFLVVLGACAQPPAEEADLAETSPEEAPGTEGSAGWLELFEDGLEGWAITHRKEAFSFEDGVLHCDGSGGGYIYWEEDQFQDFVLQGEVKISEDANSGIFLRVADPADFVQSGFEVQVLDSYGKEELDTHDFGAIYDVQAPGANASRPVGEWNSFEVTCDGPNVEIVLNDRQVISVDFRNWSQAGMNPDGSANKFEMAYAEMLHAGFIGLQDHGNPVWYRDLRIKPLD